MRGFIRMEKENCVFVGGKDHQGRTLNGTMYVDKSYADYFLWRITC